MDGHRVCVGYDVLTGVDALWLLDEIVRRSWKRNSALPPTEVMQSRIDNARRDGYAQARREIRQALEQMTGPTLSDPMPTPMKIWQPVRPRPQNTTDHTSTEE